MNNERKFTLAHYRDQKCHGWNRTCPSCGKREFSPYIDLFTGQPIDDKRCGRCNRETNCGYHLPPREWFGEHRTERREWLPREQYIARKRQERLEAEEARQKYQQREQERKARLFDPFRSEQHPDAQAYIDRMGELCCMSQSYEHVLVQWLYTKFPRERVDYVLHRYHVGGTKDGRTVFWQVDLHGNVHGGKVMAYGKDGHRVKSRGANWVHSLVGMEQLADQCLFGEHLINENCYPLRTSCSSPLKRDSAGECNHRDKANQKELYNSPSVHRGSTAKPGGSSKRSAELGDERRNGVTKRRGYSIALVESEKTAIVMSILVPQTTWLATGGKQGFKHEMLWPLCGLDVAVYPDADALDNWSRKIEQLNREHGYHLIIPDHYRAMCTPEARARKMDLVDMMLSEE